MFQLVKAAKPEPVTPKGFVKVLNRRQGEILLPCAPHSFPPGTSYHDEKLFRDYDEDEGEGMPLAVQHALAAHANCGELEFTHADVLPVAPAPVVPEVANTKPAQDGPVPLSLDVETALKQIAEQSDHAVLGAWFDSVPADHVLSAAISERYSALAT